MKIKIDNSIFWILFISPFILLAIIKLLPTFDDWTYFTTPYYDFGNSFRNILLPTADYWRPLDGLFGYLLSLSPTLFPFLNHLTIYLGHIINCILVYKLCKLLEFDKISCNIASIFFFISPAMLGTVLGIDSLNQTYATLWGLLGTFLYVKKNTPIHKIAWIVCTIFAIFF